jgi:hypothetical protein
VDRSTQQAPDLVGVDGGKQGIMVRDILLAGEEALFKSMQVPYRISYCRRRWWYKCKRTGFSTRIVGREKLNFLTRIKKNYLSLYGDCRTLLTVHSATNTVQIYMYGFFYIERR